MKNTWSYWSGFASCVLLAGLLTALPAAAQTQNRQVSRSGTRTASGGSLGFVPKHQRNMRFAATQTDSEPEIIAGATYMENAQGELVLQKGGGPIGPLTGGPIKGGPVKGGPIKGDVFEGEWIDGGCETGCLTPCNFIPSGNLEIFAGVQGFTGPTNRGGQGSFGFNEGINWGIPLPGIGSCLGAQIGFRATQSNYSGAEFTNDGRYQGFVTAGLFRRVDFGLQGGLVIDYLTDDWYRNADLTQLRGELSWVFNPQNDWGLWFTAGTNDSQVLSVFDNGQNAVQENWEPTDLYAFFYRKRFGCFDDGYFRLFAGWTGQSDGLIGTDFRLPLSDAWALESGFTYLVPNEGTGTGLQAGHVQESWNIGFNLVWYPGRGSGLHQPYASPLFRVADNGNFMVDRF